MRGGRRGGRSRGWQKRKARRRWSAYGPKTYSKEVEMIVSNRIMDAALRALAGVALALLLTGVAPVALAALAIGALA